MFNFSSFAVFWKHVFKEEEKKDKLDYEITPLKCVPVQSQNIHIGTPS